MQNKQILEAAAKMLKEGKTPYEVRSFINIEQNGPDHAFLTGAERARLVVGLFEELDITGEHEIHVQTTAELEQMKAQATELERMRALVAAATADLNKQLETLKLAQANIPTIQPGTVLNSSGQPVTPNE